MSIILRVYRSGKLVASANEYGHITVHVKAMDKPYIEFPYIHPSCRPVDGDETQQRRRWLASAEESDNE